MEQLLNSTKPRETKPKTPKQIEYAQKYYETHKDVILERARAFSKKKYQDPVHREAVRVKNENYRLMLKQARQLLLEQQQQKTLETKTA